MNVRPLYDMLLKKHGADAEPGTWWPIYHGQSEPPEFERTISNILVSRNSSWHAAVVDLGHLHEAGLLTAGAFARASVE